LATRRRGCYYCLRTLNPQDEQIELRTFGKCSNCNAILHAVCWRDYGKCPRCDEDQSQPVELSQSAPLRVVTKTRALPIKPSIVVQVRDSGELVYTHQRTTWRERVTHFAQKARAIVLGVFFIVMTTFVGVFAYRISQLEFLTAESLMDALFREPLPPTRVFVGAFIVGAVCALVFYSHLHSGAPEATKSTQTTEGAVRFTHLMAGIVTIVGFDLMLFNFSPQDMVNFSINLYPYQETLDFIGVYLRIRDWRVHLDRHCVKGAEYQ